MKVHNKFLWQIRLNWKGPYSDIFIFIGDERFYEFSKELSSSAASHGLSPPVCFVSELIMTK
jgi:hypothetical protein